jgi:hypothetical protein
MKMNINEPFVNLIFLILSRQETYIKIKGYKDRIEQTDKSARITVCGDAIEEIVTDYTTLRLKPEIEG